VVIFPSDFHETEDGHLLWRPEKVSEVDRNSLNVFLAPFSKGVRVGGSFFGFVPEQAADETIIYEDGFLVMLTDGSWHLLRQCLSRGTNCFVQSDTTKGLNAEISFYTTQHEEDGKKENNVAPTTNHQIMVITPKEDLVKRVSTETLSEYANSFIEPISTYLKKVQPQLEGIKQVILQFDIEPGSNVSLKTAVRPSPQFLNPSIKQELGLIVKNVPVVDVKEGVVQFQLYFNILN